jgi:hypothetical protein
MTLLMINENCRFCISLLFSLLFFGFLLLLGFFLFPALILLFVVPHQKPSNTGRSITFLVQPLATQPPDLPPTEQEKQNEPRTREGKKLNRSKKD